MQIQYHYASDLPYWISVGPKNLARPEIVEYLRSSAYMENIDYKVSKTGQYIRMKHNVYADWIEQFWQHRYNIGITFAIKDEIKTWLYNNYPDHDFMIGIGKLGRAWNIENTFYFRNYADLVQFKLTWG